MEVRINQIWSTYERFDFIPFGIQFRKYQLTICIFSFVFRFMWEEKKDSR